MSALKYAEVEGRHIAYRIHDGAADHNLVLFTPGGTIPMGALEDDRIGARLIGGLRAVGRLLVFDRLGIGLSDPITDWERPLVEQWADDLATVIEAAGLDQPVVVALGDYWGPARLFAGQNPEVLGKLVLYEPNGPTDPVDLRRTTIEDSDLIALVCPSRVDDTAFRQWFDMAGRTGASPAVATAFCMTGPTTLVSNPLSKPRARSPCRRLFFVGRRISSAPRRLRTRLRAPSLIVTRWIFRVRTITGSARMSMPF